MAPDERYRFGPFCLEVSRRRLSNGGQRVQLTPKALDTLTALVRHAGHTVDKDDLLKAVWGDTFVEEATLAQNIAALRRVFGETPDNPTYIATVPRRGYRFIGPIAPVDDVADAAVPAVAAPDTPTRSWTIGTRTPLWIALGAVVLVALGIGALRRHPAERAPSPVARFLIPPPDGTHFSTRGGFMSVSPDGRFIAFVAMRSDRVESVWVRALDGLESRPVADTEGAAQLFWSPGSDRLAFFAAGKLKTVPIAGGEVTVVCDIPGGSDPLAGTWNADGDILFSEVRQPIFRVSASGGVPEPLPLAGVAKTETVAWPQFLPDGKRFLFVMQSPGADRAGLYLATLDGRSQRLSAMASFTLPVPGYLLYVDAGMLEAQPFDADAGRLSASRSTLAYRVAFNPGTLRGVFTASQNGLFAFRTADQSQLTWVARDGSVLGKLGEVGTYLDYSISPDGREVAASMLDPATGAADIRILSADGGARRVTEDSALNVSPLWSRDGSSVAFSSRRGGHWSIMRKASRVPGAEEPLLDSESMLIPKDWLGDGRVLFTSPQSTRELRETATTPGAPSQLIFEGVDGIGAARVSPDGQWLAHETHRAIETIVVRAMRAPDQSWSLSANEGLEPRWRADSREIYYLGSDLSLMAVSVAPGDEFRPSAAARLFRADIVGPSGVAGDVYDAAPDGQRFLLKVAASRSPIVVVTNWQPPR